MKYLISGAILSLLFSCSHTNKMSTSALKGKLVVSELCAHYVITVTGSNIPKEKLAESWKDDKRNTTYTNAFTVANRCAFEKEDIKEGDEFTFVFDENAQPETCAVCMAFYPTPAQTLAIKDIKKITPQ